MRYLIFPISEKDLFKRKAGKNLTKSHKKYLGN